MSTPMDWDKLRVFHAVAEAGSFTHAGEALNLSQSAVTRQISTLKSRLQRLSPDDRSSRWYGSIRSAVAEATVTRHQAEPDSWAARLRWLPSATRNRLRR